MSRPANSSVNGRSGRLSPAEGVNRAVSTPSHTRRSLPAAAGQRFAGVRLGERLFAPARPAARRPSRAADRLAYGRLTKVSECRNNDTVVFGNMRLIGRTNLGLLSI